MPKKRHFWLIAVTCWILFGCASALAQRVRNAAPAAQAEPPTVVGKVVAYMADQSIVLESSNRNGAKTSEFAILTDKTKIDLPPRIKEIKVGQSLAVWADKDNAKIAARIGQQAGGGLRGNRRPANRGQGKPAASPQNVESRKPAEGRQQPPRIVRQPVAGLAPLAVARQIDHEIDARLAADKVPASPTCDDAEFIRRVYLDIAGVIPRAETVVTFLDSSDADKRARLIDELLARENYGWHFADLWCERIVTRELPVEKELFIRWLADGLNQGRGWNEVVFDMLTAEGSFSFATRGRRLAASDPAALFLLVNTENAGSKQAAKPEWLAAESGRLFLGVQIQCAECHDHPFTDAWKQTDFWGLAAFFGQLRAERLPAGGLSWTESPAAPDAMSIVIPATALKAVGTSVPARLLGEGQDYRPGNEQFLRHSLARWMTSPDNRLFAKATANRLWAHFFGRGLVHPVDDLRADNPPSHPAILELLADELRKSEFDLKHLIRCLCLSQAYQRTSLPLAENESDEGNYSHRAIKVLASSVLYDSLTVATGFPEMQLGLPQRKTVLTTITALTPRESFMDFFRLAAGEEPDPLEYMHGMPQKLKLLNAAQLNSVYPVATKLAGEGYDRAQAIEQLYLTALARRPTETESRLMADFLARREDARPEEAYSAVLWVLINGSEFVLNR